MQEDISQTIEKKNIHESSFIRVHIACTLVKTFNLALAFYAYAFYMSLKSSLELILIPNSFPLLSICSVPIFTGTLL